MEVNKTARVLQMKLKNIGAPIRSDTAKVKVQFIHQPIVDKAKASEQLNCKQPIESSGEEVENVEYLDECSGEEYHTPTPVEHDEASTIPNFKDTFYPNAIQCLIALYRSKYEELEGKTHQQIMTVPIWDQISSEMNESFFEFNSEQVKHKFRQLRQQYFSVSTSREIEDFEYFDHLHEIYRDKVIQAIATGNRPQTEKPQAYPDDILQRDVYPEEEQEELHSESTVYDAATALPYQTTSHEVEVVTQQHDEIAHKEHEFIDMVEKELQAIEEGNAKTTAAAAQQQTEGGTPTPTTTPQSLNEELVCNNEIIHHQEEILQHASPIASHQGQVLQREVLLVPSSATVQTVYIKREQPEVNDTKAKRMKLEASTVPALVRTFIEPNKQQQQQSQPTSQATAEIHPPISVSPTDETGATCKDISSLADYNAARERRHQEKMALMRQSLQLQERAIEIQQHLMEELIKRL